MDRGQTMAVETPSLRKTGLKLKALSGWFAAGASFKRALSMLSDGAFKLFAYISMESDRGTGRYQATQTDLASVLGKSRRIINKYIAELEREGICKVTVGRNQYARSTFEILDDYWPYDRQESVEDANRKQNAYVAAVRDSFLAIECGSGRFNISDEKTAAELEKRGIPLNLVQDAILVGTCRKYVSWLNNGPSEPIASLAYFAPVITEIQEQPLPAGYTDHLRATLHRLAKTWHESATARKSAANLQV